MVFWQPTSSCCCSIRSNEQLSSTARSYQPSSTGCQCQIDWTTIIHCQILSTIIHWVSVSDRLNNYHPLSDPINHHPLGVSVRSTEQLSSTVRSYQPSSTGCQINWTTIIHCQILSTIIHWVSVSDQMNIYHPLSDPINHHPLGVSVRSTEQLSSTVRSYQPSSIGCQCQINWTTTIHCQILSTIIHWVSVSDQLNN